jgi:2-octaprenyl-6-methoxyphenol hydroxylase
VISPDTPVFDLAIAGAGAAGLALAAAVGQALRGGAAVAVIDPAPAPVGAGPGSIRTVAIAEGPRRLLAEVGVWHGLEPKAQPILSMEIMDGGVRDAVRLPHLHFDSEDRAPLAHMAFNDDVTAALARRCEQLGVRRLPASVAGWRAGRGASELLLSTGESIRARLAVAAAGARSKLAALADVPVAGWDYPQSGLVATIAHERDHEGRAEQHFLPAGPFAILPLPGRQSSIVWNEARADAADLLKLEPADLLHQLEPRFTARLGEIQLASRVEAFPFRFQIARRFVAERLALVGDAAHVVHPLAGQGLNLGFRDVAALAETIVKAMRLGLDPGAREPLADYQRTRRFDIAANGLGMDAMNRLFSNDVAPLRLVRDLGLRLVDRAPRLKDLLIGEAGGAGPGAPRLLRGLPL